jgi:hypothetical protein
LNVTRTLAPSTFTSKSPSIGSFMIACPPRGAPSSTDGRRFLPRNLRTDGVEMMARKILASNLEAGIHCDAEAPRPPLVGVGMGEPFRSLRIDFVAPGAPGTSPIRKTHHRGP